MPFRIHTYGEYNIWRISFVRPFCGTCPWQAKAKCSTWCVAHIVTLTLTVTVNVTVRHHINVDSSYDSSINIANIIWYGTPGGLLRVRVTVPALSARPSLCFSQRLFRRANCAKVTCGWQSKLTMSFGRAQQKLRRVVRNCPLIASHFFSLMRRTLVNDQNVSINKFYFSKRHYGST